jgi:hypothetical protein
MKKHALTLAANRKLAVPIHENFDEACLALLRPRGVATSGMNI